MPTDGHAKDRMQMTAIVESQMRRLVIQALVLALSVSTTPIPATDYIEFPVMLVD